MSRHYNLLDRIVGEADKVLRTLASDAARPLRPSPAATLPEAGLSGEEKRQVAGFMRINHTGEVCAQALYHGQALTARLPQVRQDMQRAAQEEVDHLAWCNERLATLNAAPSILNPLFYAASFGVGALAGMAGDKWSLGFVAETEQQVCEHLQGHLTRLPLNDLRTRAVLTQMHKDEAEHRDMALQAGAAELPPPVQQAMRLLATVMTKTTYYV